MEQLEIMAKLRTRVGKSNARKCRRGDVVPAVCYGKNTDPVHIEISTNLVRKAISTPYKLNTIINLNISSDKEVIRKKVLIKDVQKDALGKKILHMDFVEVKDDQPVKVKVPVRLVGKAKGVAEGGILQQIIRDLDMKCLPQDIPVAIEHDVTQLKMGEAVHVRDLKVPEKAKVLVDKDRTVAVVIEVKEELAAPVVAAATAESASTAEGAAPASTAPASTATSAAKPAQPEKK